MRVLNNNLLDAIFDEIKNNNKVTEVYLSKKYNCSERTIRRYIKILKDENKIYMDSFGREKIWIINE